MYILGLLSTGVSRLAAMALLLLALAIPVVAIGWPGLNWHRQLAEDVAIGLEQLGRARAGVGEERQQAEALAAVQVPTNLFLAPASETSQLAAVQARLVEISANQSLQLLSSSQLPARSDSGVRLLGVRVSFRAEMASVQRMLHAVEDAHPLLFVDAAELRAEIGPASSAPSGPIMIDAVLDVYGAGIPAGAQAADGASQ